MNWKPAKCSLFGVFSASFRVYLPPSTRLLPPLWKAPFLCAEVSVLKLLLSKLNKNYEDSQGFFRSKTSNSFIDWYWLFLLIGQILRAWFGTDIWSTWLHTGSSIRFKETVPWNRHFKHNPVWLPLQLPKWLWPTTRAQWKSSAAASQWSHPDATSCRSTGSDGGCQEILPNSPKSSICIWN